MAKMRLNGEIKLYYNFFRIIFYIEFFVFPISAGLLSYAAIKGRKKRPFVFAMVSSFIMLIVSLIGIYLNAPPEIRESMRTSLEQSFSVEQ